MPSRDLKYLHPKLRQACESFLRRCKTAGVTVIITSTLRTLDEQEALYAQGREKLAYVNALRAKCGMPKLSEAQNKRRVTWTKQSRHLPDPNTGYCEAFDFCVVHEGKAIWDTKVSLDDDEIPDYTEAGIIAQSLGLEWGGVWQKPDYCHCQMKREEKS